MKKNKLIWGLTLTLVLVTIAVSFGTRSSYSQKEIPNQQKENSFGDLSKYPTIEYDAPEPLNAAEREERRIKNKRYDKYLLVSKSAYPGDFASIVTDGDPMPDAFPVSESSLVVVGEILASKALMSNDKSGVYSEYSVRIETILKEDRQRKLQPDLIITMDRAGGVVQYPNGQKMLYLNSWQALQYGNERYVLFLAKDNDQNSNYRLLTGYQISNGKITALDNHPDFREFNGKSEAEFINLVLKNNQAEVKSNEEKF